MTSLEDELRGYFQRVGQDIPDRFEIRARVVSRLESVSEETDEVDVGVVILSQSPPPAVGAEDRLTAPIANRARLRFAALAACLLLGLWLGAGELLDIGNGDVDSVESVGQPNKTAPAQPRRAPLEVPGREYTSSSFALPLRLILPNTELGTWVVESETATALSVLLQQSTVDVREQKGPMIRILALPQGTSPQDVQASLSELFDTDLVEQGNGTIGGFTGWRMVMESRRGTAEIGFRLAPDTYVVAEGIDRRYEANIVDAGDRIFVVWIDAVDSEFDQIRPDAEQLVASITIT